MARIFGTGFENQDLSMFSQAPSSKLVSSDELGMSGDYCLKMDLINAYAQIMLPQQKTELFIAFKFRPFHGIGKVNLIIGFYDYASDLTGGLIINSSSKLQFCLSGSTGITSGSKTILPNVTYTIEIHYIPLNTGGTFIVKVDGVEDINYTGDTTYGLENCNSIRFGYYYPSTIYTYSYFDDIIIDDADWIGLGHVFVGGAITGAGSSTQWTSSTAATNYANVDEIPYSDTDYNSTNTTDALDLYTLNDCLNGLDVASVSGVYLNIRTSYEGGPTPTGIQPALKSDVTTGYAATISLSASFFNQQKIFEINPNTAATFTTSDFTNGIEVGVKAVV